MDHRCYENDADYTEVWAPRPLLPLIRFADRARAIADTGLDLLGVIETARVPALATFDSIYSWYGTNRPEFRAAVSHLPIHLRSRVAAARRRNSAHCYAAAPGRKLRRHSPSLASSPIAETLAYGALPCRSFPQLDVPVKWTAGPEEPLRTRRPLRRSLRPHAALARRRRAYIGATIPESIGHLAAAVGLHPSSRSFSPPIRVTILGPARQPRHGAGESSSVRASRGGGTALHFYTCPVR